MIHNCYYSGPSSDHFDGTQFFNSAPPFSDRGVWDFLVWRLTSRRAHWPDSVPVNQIVPEARSDSARITVVGHATVLIQARGFNLVTDPIWSERAGPLPLSPRRVAAPAIAFDDLPPIHVVLLSHNHYDHLDIATLRCLVQRHRPLIVTALGNDAIVRQSVPGANVQGHDWGGRHSLSDDFEITLVPARHWSMRLGWDRRMSLWCGFVLRAGRALIYFSGDTGYGDGSVFDVIRRDLGAPDLALLPIGAYAPRWLMADQHTDPREVVTIFQRLQACQALGIHWGVFRLSDEGRNEPCQALALALAEQRIEPARFPAAEPGHVWAASARPDAT